MSSRYIHEPPVKSSGTFTYDISTIPHIPRHRPTSRVCVWHRCLQSLTVFLERRECLKTLETGRFLCSRHGRVWRLLYRKVWHQTSTPWKFNIATEKLQSQKERIVFQPSFFRGELLNFGGVTDRNVEIVKVIYNDVLLGGRATGLLSTSSTWSQSFPIAPGFRGEHKKGFEITTWGFPKMLVPNNHGFSY